jgi:MFS family permease
MNNIKIKFKAFQFFQFGIMGVWAFYLPVFFSQRGFSGYQIGALLGTMPIVVIGLQPVWSFLSDRLNTRKTILLISCIGMGLTITGVGLASSFTFVMLWFILFSAFWAPINPISAAMLLEFLEETDEVGKYSLFRLWGSLGFGIISLLVGSFLLGQYINSLTWLAGGLYFFLGILSVFLPEKRVKTIHTKEKPNQTLKGNPKLIFYLLGSVFIGATLGIYNNTISLFLEFLNTQDWLIGLIISLQAFIEVLLMWVTPYIMKRCSQRWFIFTATLLLVFRWVFYLIIQIPGWIAPFQIIHGIAIVSSQVVGISFIDQLINPRWRATVQGIYSTAYNGVGVAMGVYLAGLVMEWFGIRSVWVLNIILGVIGLVLLAIAFNSKQQAQDPLVLTNVFEEKS